MSTQAWCVPRYATSANFHRLEEMGIEPVIPAQPERASGSRIPARRFKYDARHDLVACPQGRKLRRAFAKDEGRVYVAAASDCRKCRLRQQCLYSGTSSRKLYIADGHAALLRARRRKNRWKEECAETYTRHKWIVEGRIAETKTRHGMSRAVRRGLGNVMIQLLLTAMAMNLKRLATPLFMPFLRLLASASKLTSPPEHHRLNSPAILLSASLAP